MAEERVQNETKRLEAEAERLERALASKSSPPKLSLRSKPPLWNGQSGYSPAHLVKPS